MEIDYKKLENLKFLINCNRDRVHHIENNRIQRIILLLTSLIVLISLFPIFPSFFDRYTKLFFLIIFVFVFVISIFSDYKEYKGLISDLNKQIRGFNQLMRREWTNTKDFIKT